MSNSYPTIGSSVPGPEHLGELVLERVLGSGAFGIVFQATASRTGSKVAVKFLQAGVLATPHERQALFNEVLSAKEVEHEHVLRVLHANTDTESYPPFVVMDFADRGTLQARLDEARRAKSPIPLEVVAKWSLNLVSAMRAINARLLHRDLKPDNILFVGETLKVSDFGLAKLVGATTRTVTFKGGQHVLYMAPEAWEGERNDIQIDMYAAGIVIFQVASLDYPYRLPADGADLDAFRRMHLLQPPKALKSIRSDLPHRFGEVVHRLLSKRPEDRYRTWDEITASLERSFAQTSDSVSGKAPVVASLVEQAAQRHREATTRQLEEEALRRTRAEQHEVDCLQQAQVVDRFRELIESFNAETEGRKGTLEEFPDGRFEVRLPYAQTGALSFFKIDPPLNLQPHDARFGALVADSKGCGFNLLLRRRPGEQYGEWAVCRVRVNPISGRAHKHCDYFGFGPREVIEIQRGHRAAHVFVPEFSNDVDGAIQSFLKSLY
ncbi:MAG TPA: serine/threonine-protein kinase [Planctomycetota bacterium]|jgi:NIMA (never in mitosis gene a)-related kinase/serine/threonine-protein kinase|nr:serine/threonine-protein kinase [Planctomycetota bacterium]